MMNTMLTAVDCACSVLMIGAAGIDHDDTSSFESIAFVLQLVALIGESEQACCRRGPNSSNLLQHPTRYSNLPIWPMVSPVALDSNRTA